MKKYKGYLIDLDGTVYTGKNRIDTARDFIIRLVEEKIPYLFVTNNSLRTPNQVSEMLNEMEIPSTPDHVYTVGQAAASYVVEQNPNARVFLIGEEGVQKPFAELGIQLVTEDPDFVVTGLAVRAGATFISTNPDIALPTEKGFYPGNGAMTAVISTSTRVNPIFIGKPEAIIMEQAVKLLGIPKEDMLMVGDFYGTDIMAGINAEMDTLLVLTGVSQREHLKEVDIQPTYVINSLDEWEL
ncbi:MAG: HAD-superfamily subfamily hydrolase like protein [Bacillales bacterium]|nr:HAD-superfamily subfamily hydrolase like protein [Bacillales bacterium]